MELVDYYTDFNFFDQTNPNLIFETAPINGADIINCFAFDTPPLNKEEIKLSGDGVEAPSAAHLGGSPIQISYGKPQPKEALTSKGGDRKRTADETRGRIMAERKRREKLNENFISLSALIPGLKKMDKGSIMEDAIAYLKELQDSVNSLEKNIDNHSYKSENSESDDDNNSDNFGNGWKNQYGEDIKTTVSGRNILIQIYCNKIKGLEATLMSEIGKFGLTVVSSSFMQFGQNNMAITFVTEMDVDFNAPIEDLVKILGWKIKGP